MEAIVLSKIGTYVLMLIEAIFVYAAFFIGHSVNGIPAELAVLLGSALVATDILAIFLVKHYFKV